MRKGSTLGEAACKLVGVTENLQKYIAQARNIFVHERWCPSALHFTQKLY